MKRILGILAVVLLVSGCASVGGLSGHYVPVPDGKYDNHVYLVDPEKMSLEAVVGSISNVVTKAFFKIKKGDKKSFTELLGGFGVSPDFLEDEIEKRMKGSGVVIYGRYFLTMEHVATNQPLTIQFPFGTMFLPYDKAEEKHYLDLKNGELTEMKPLYVDPKNDIALFEIQQNIKTTSFPYILGNSDELKVGNFTYVIGTPGKVAVSVREGIVGALKSPKGSGIKHQNVFLVSSEFSPGDSGSPVLAVRDGKYELVGLAQAVSQTFYGINVVVRINVIRELLLKAPGVPDEFKRFLKNEAGRK